MAVPVTTTTVVGRGAVGAPVHRTAGAQRGGPHDTPPPTGTSALMVGETERPGRRRTPPAVGAGSARPATTTTTTAPAKPPAPPTGLTVRSGNGAVTVSWSESGDGGGPSPRSWSPPTSAVTPRFRWTYPSSNTSEVVGRLSDGTAYTFTVTASQRRRDEPPSAPSASVTPVASALRTVNGGGGGRDGPRRAIRSSSPSPPAPAPGALCSGWTTGSTPDLVDPGVVVQATEPSSGDDTITVTDAADCAGGFHFGTIDLGQRGYFDGAASFGGSGSSCRSARTSGCSTIHWDGPDTLTVTLGKESSVQPFQPLPSVMVYTPDPALGLPGTISSGSQENF